MSVAIAFYGITAFKIETLKLKWIWVFFQNEEIFVQLDELDELDIITDT